MEKTERQIELETEWLEKQWISILDKERENHRDWLSEKWDEYHGGADYTEDEKAQWFEEEMAKFEAEQEEAKAQWIAERLAENGKAEA